MMRPSTAQPSGSPRPAATRCGLTLLEVVVVLGVLAVLMNVLVTATAPARERARMTACTSHLHQLLEAAAMYEADYGGVPVHLPIGVYGQAAHWEEKLYPYAKSKGVFLCASDPTGGLYNALGGWPCSYEYFYTDVWLGPGGAYRAPRVGSPLLADTYHSGSRGVMLIARYGTWSVEASPPGRYLTLGFEPADGLGDLSAGPGPGRRER